jgi:hypothetical protein
MAWLPIIAETDRRSYGAAVARWTDFLAKFAERGVTLPAPEKTPVFPLAGAGQLSMARINALIQAAALYLTADQSAQGWSLLRLAWERLRETEGDASFVRLALTGALLGQAEVSLDAEKLTVAMAPRSTERVWENLDALPETAGALLAAAAASGHIGLGGPGPLARFLSAVPEFPVAWFLTRREGEGPAQLAFAALHQRYGAHLRTMADRTRPWWGERDRHGYDPEATGALLPPPSADLVPWPLLAIHFGLIRRDGSAERWSSSDPYANALSQFLSDIARELS